MARRFESYLYLLTGLALINLGVARFDDDVRFFSQFHLRAHLAWFVTMAITDFLAAGVFLLAGVCSLSQTRKSAAAATITSMVIIAVLFPLLTRRSYGWTLFAKAAGPIVSVLFVLAFSSLQPSSFACIAAAIYALLQGLDLVHFLQSYFSSDTWGAVTRVFLVEVIPAVLVAASSAVALALTLTRRLRTA